MTAFIGRKSELEALNREYKRDNGFVVIYGRRRVGKTTLIKEFIKDKDALYFLATEQIESENIKSFVESFAGFSGQDYLSDVGFKRWESIFEAFAAYKPNEKKVLVIDEFQYLISINPAFASVFQKIWDTILTDKNIMVILCGSLISMMLNQVLAYKSPLYGRRTAQIRLSPLRFYELKEYYKNMQFDEFVKLYSVTNGVPKYFELFNNRLPLIDNIKNEIFRKQGFLYEEPTFLLEKEVKDTVSYFSIIKTIALGNHKLGAISTALELKGTQITPYLKTLMDLDIIEKRVPITEKNPEKSRKGLYYIKDNFIEFWFKLVAPFKSELEIENMKTALNKLKGNFIDNHVSFVFEEISKDTLRKLCAEEKIVFDFSKIGSYWDGQRQIDICAIDEENKICLLGECKFLEKPVSADIYFELLKKAEQIAELKNFSIAYAVFSKSGFDKRLIDIAADNKNLYLINEDECINTTIYNAKS